MKKISTLLLSLIVGYGYAQTADSVTIRKMYDEALARGKSYEWLRYLTKQIGPRLSGSAGAQKAVDWTKQIMEQQGFDRVFLQDVMVPHWVRGAKEEAYIQNGKQKITVPIAALGGSVATGPKGVNAGVIEVKSFAELRAMSTDKVKGKIVFYNRPMDPTKINTFEAYGGAVEQRANGATEAAKLGAVGAIVRSMNPRHDDYPHVGGMRYATGVPLIPTAAISTNGADLLSKLLQENPNLTFYFKENCETLPDAKSYNVVGEIKGSEKPDEIIVVGGHLDSWDLAEGAQDDGAGCMQSIEVLRLFKALGIKPKRTIRAVMFMNEENGLRGGVQYADLAKKNNEKHMAAVESDAGGFTPRGFGIVGTPEQRAKVMPWKPLLAPYGLLEIGPGGGGADIGPLAQLGTVLFGFKPDSQRYFDYHHTAVDNFEAVSQRELELGAASMAALVYLLDQYGL
ncbi:MULTISPECIES: M20/M25/M40 family metallo-hydrolase [unclassified Spirosoma]|uniref:M20/M25/M40 family metallo-hydrolase n=1 Tax=unclassified Spirosoma TaxID=2621999 RepID=UPI0009633BF9|nr:MULTISPECIES: M20/M25/M40 family metallo-hydrolase [unclassified Spirosoma]MBN8824692.1 M20/M25/M40 family metallo-hydrolase [Spirosoma sp.]OJW78762.1 MAG: peptidase M28 family protein [Spirosoma sp. 48-14]